MLTPQATTIASHSRQELSVDPALRALLHLNLTAELAQLVGEQSRKAPRRRSQALRAAALTLLEQAEQA